MLTQVNLGGLLAWEFLLMHWVEVRRWQDYKKFGSVNEVSCIHFSPDFASAPVRHLRVLVLSVSCSAPGLWTERMDMHRMRCPLKAALRP